MGCIVSIEDSSTWRVFCCGALFVSVRLPADYGPDGFEPILDRVVRRLGELPPSAAWLMINRTATSLTSAERRFVVSRARAQFSSMRAAAVVADSFLVRKSAETVALVGRTVGIRMHLRTFKVAKTNESLDWLAAQCAFSRPDVEAELAR